MVVQSCKRLKHLVSWAVEILGASQLFQSHGRVAGESLTRLFSQLAECTVREAFVKRPPLIGLLLFARMIFVKLHSMERRAKLMGKVVLREGIWLLVHYAVEQMVAGHPVSDQTTT